MQIVYHIGTHCTDQEALHGSIVKKNEMLVQKRVALPHPRKYLDVIGEHLQAMTVGSRPKKRAGAVGRYTWQYRSRSHNLEQEQLYLRAEPDI